MRKRTSSLSTPHRAVDVSVDPAHSAILFRDARGVRSFTAEKIDIEQFVSASSDRSVCCNFRQAHVR